MDNEPKEHTNVHVIKVDMENRPVEEIARDAAILIAALCDNLLEKQKREKDV